MTLKGGKKRKLQRAIGIVGLSLWRNVYLVRRALWRILTSVRRDRTVVFTTHFLDEADLLTDKMAILDAPGKLVAEGTPVALKHKSNFG